MDQVQVIKSTSTFAKTPEVGGFPLEYMKRGTYGDGGGHMFGYATCHWIRKCNTIEYPNEAPGSACSAPLAGVTYSGFCFRAQGGTLECGYTSAIDDEYGESPVSFTSTGAGGIVRRCPTGSPAKSAGQYTSKRMKIAGCMVPTDASYDAIAEVHVPAYCTTPTDYKKGCLLPAALNFDPAAVQCGECTWPTKGCTDSNSFNYNVKATVSDSANYPCTVARLNGCTVKSAAFEGVPTDSPGYNNGKFAFQNVGTQYYPKGSGIVPFQANSVTNYNSEANANTGCVVAVEGCMDSTAVNYNALATVNSNSWCIPKVVGCMDPAAANYAPAATVNSATDCIAARPGCQDPTALNYDSKATVSKGIACYLATKGCLNPSAKNAYCPNYLDESPCTPASASNPSGVTDHKSYECRFEDFPPAPPAPPSPRFPPVEEGIKQTYKLKLKITIEGVCPSAIDTSGEPMATAFATFQGVSLDDVNVDIDMCGVVTTFPRTDDSATSVSRQLAEGRGLSESGEIPVELSTEYEDPAAMETAKATVATEVGTSRASLQSSFGAAAGVTVTSAPVIEVEVVQVTAPPSPPGGGSSAGVIIGIVVGVIAVLLIVGAVIVIRKRRAAKDVYPA
jgi:hypothetical protein